MKARVTSNPRKAGATPNNRLPNGACAVAESLDPHELFYASLYGNRATRRLAKRNMMKKMKAAPKGDHG